MKIQNQETQNLASLPPKLRILKVKEGAVQVLRVASDPDWRLHEVLEPAEELGGGHDGQEGEEAAAVGARQDHGAEDEEDGQDADAHSTGWSARTIPSVDHRPVDEEHDVLPVARIDPLPREQERKHERQHQQERRPHLGPVRLHDAGPLGRRLRLPGHDAVAVDVVAVRHVQQGEKGVPHEELADPDVRPPVQHVPDHAGRVGAVVEEETPAVVAVGGVVEDRGEGEGGRDRAHEVDLYAGEAGAAAVRVVGLDDEGRVVERGDA
ncbi:unnamed protein product [Sphagnum tenellum]